MFNIQSVNAQTKDSLIYLLKKHCVPNNPLQCNDPNFPTYEASAFTENKCACGKGRYYVLEAVSCSKCVGGQYLDITTGVGISADDNECKEYINKHTNSACAREGIVSWDAVREQGYFDTFKGQGSAIPFSKRVGKSPQEVMKLAEIYMATRQLKDKGHKDYNEFVNLFLWHVENNKISLPAQPKVEKKVVTGADVLKVYG